MAFSVGLLVLDSNEEGNPNGDYMQGRKLLAEKINNKIDEFSRITTDWAAANGYISGGETPQEVFERLEADTSLADRERDLLIVISDLKAQLRRVGSRSGGATVRYNLGAIIVPISNPNGHNYTLGEPVCIAEPASLTTGRRADGTYGNNLPTVKEAVRPATHEEIVSYVYSLCDPDRIIEQR